MKKLLILILIVLVFTLTIYTIMKGIEISNFSIWGINTMKNENTQLNEMIVQATKLANSIFPRKINEVNTNMEELQEQKEVYESMVNASNSENVETSSQFSNYTLDFLWTKIGTHATTDGVNIDIYLTMGTDEKNLYNLNFTTAGSYISICEFIRDIEDDSDLGFKIEQFSMTAGESTSDLKATFVCNNIPIEGVSSIDTQKENTSHETANNTINPNSTNATSNVTSTNHTNTSSNVTSTNHTNTTNTTN